MEKNKKYFLVVNYGYPPRQYSMLLNFSESLLSLFKTYKVTYKYIGCTQYTLLYLYTDLIIFFKWGKLSISTQTNPIMRSNLNVSIFHFLSNFVEKKLNNLSHHFQQWVKHSSILAGETAHFKCESIGSKKFFQNFWILWFVQ